MARVDKTNSAIGVVRAVLAADIATNLFDTVIGVGLDSSGKIVKGAGQTGVIGVIVPSATVYKAGNPTDIFVLADILETGLAAGSKIYADNTTGVVSTTNTGTLLGFTVEAGRLLVRR